jgi:HD-like signal output (HDOD) protein
MLDTDKFCAELRAKLASQQLPVIRQTSTKLIAQLSSPATDADAIAHTIRRDQAFATRILAIANSPYYRRSTENITTIKRAVLQIGYDIIRDIAIAADYVELAHKCGSSVPYLGRLLAKAFVAAHQTMALCDAIGLPDSESLFTSALLESLGEVALAVHMPAVYEGIAAVGRRQELSYEEAHRQVTGLPPHAVTVLVAADHQLPEELILASPDWDMPSEWNVAAQRSAVVHLTNACARNLFTADSPQVRSQFNEVMSVASRVLDMPAATLTLLLTTAFEKAVEFGMHVSLGHPYFAIEAPATTETPRQKVVGTLADCYVRLSKSRAFEVAYRIYSLPI